MPTHAPRTELATHTVFNQPDELGARNLFSTDVPLSEAALREGGADLAPRLASLGEAAGSERVLDLGADANRDAPELATFDRFGRRIDEVRFHPAYHALMGLAMDHGIHDVAWEPGRRRGGHVAHAAMLATFSKAEAGTMCPINMTYASVAALRAEADATAPWLTGIVGGRYDPALRPIAEKRGLTLGMAMTEKQGGSDVRANETRAFPLEGGGSRAFRLVGHKWFCSAPMSDGFLTLAQAEGGLTCFLVPRIAPDGTRNAIHLMRLKDKLGNRSNASAEIEYHDAYAERLGEEGRGVRTIIDMVHHTRLGTIAATLGLMGMALAQAVHHARGRRAFGALLVDQPVMRGVLADLAVEYEAACVLVMRVARAFDGADEAERAFARLGVALAKFWLTKRCPAFVAECMECLGGAGYVEENVLPRLYREAPLNAIWEGSGNVIALDILRTLSREPAARSAFVAELAGARGADAGLDAAADALIRSLSADPPGERNARFVAERMALLLQGALLLRHAPSAVAGAFVASRLRGDSGRLFGSFAGAVDVDGVLSRQMTSV
ncbi:acyl-CoA dehydrogenase family protein [Antarcticirhabdus aurantiaca]|uniref:Acyl-CoA dehydrogenase family protein n=1 Tax=Antarcticirhabdus aurantiaca TaxID=2606717 RepID=A0ACD4NI18_9HYPH|nr:acyl-CoA dehydrogenase family protein [Antarcticirhabdus aurantiaca]WAJ26432.1 acyl-CoA dehydrogenase family protein [Jeongeuplla avenae]